MASRSVSCQIAATREIQINHPNTGDTMTIIHKPFDAYKLSYSRAGELVGSGSVTFYSGQTSVGSIIFRQSGSTLNAPNLVDGKIWLYYPLSSFHDIVDILRNERPLHLYLDPDSKFGGIGTETEPTGEAEN
jgi:hypothetical protein